jgi:hypothetical protein
MREKILKSLNGSRWAAFVFLGWVIPLAAQDNAPKPPYLAEKAPMASNWTIAFTYAAGPDSRPTAPKLQQKRVVKTDITKTANIKLERGYYDGGAVQDIWTSGGLMVLKDPNYAHKIVRRPAVGDFPELLWVNEAQYKGRERVGDKDCLIFEKELYPLQFADPGLFAAAMAQEVLPLDLGSPLPVTAWIDANSKLPVKMKVGEDVRTYTFNPAPASPLVIPPDYGAAIAGVEEKYRALVKPLAKP